MKYLLDINLLIALAHQDHADHEKVSRWFRSLQMKDDSVLTCAISELGFVRVSVQTGLCDTIASAQTLLVAMMESSKVPFKFSLDSIGVSKTPRFVKKPSQLTDGHLLELASANGAQLATLDTGIPGAFLIV